MNITEKLSPLLWEEREAAEEARLWEEDARSLSEAFGPQKEELERKIAVARATSIQAPCWNKEAMLQIAQCMTQLDQDQLRIDQAYCQAHDARKRLKSLQKYVKELQKEMGRDGCEMREDRDNSSHYKHGNVSNADSADIVWRSSDFNALQMDEDVEEEDLPDGPISMQDAVNGVRYTALHLVP